MHKQAKQAKDETMRLLKNTFEETSSENNQKDKQNNNEHINKL